MSRHSIFPIILVRDITQNMRRPAADKETTVTFKMFRCHLRTNLCRLLGNICTSHSSDSIFRQTHCNHSSPDYICQLTILTIHHTCSLSGRKFYIFFTNLSQHRLLGRSCVTQCKITHSDPPISYDVV